LARAPGVTSHYQDDLDLARRCADGDEAAWERFVREYRPQLYRAADALDPGGGARDLADSLYGDLYGVENRGGQRRSLFRYFQGRSSLATWLRAVLAQRYVDRLRAERRLEPLPDEEERPLRRSRSRAIDVEPADPDQARHLALLHEALGRAIDRLDTRDRLRLGCYYAQQLTLAETGRVLKEHEATVSRQLAKTRATIREQVERELRERGGLSAEQIAQCLNSAADDPGPLDLSRMLCTGSKEPAPDPSVS
jgi:RNA polymerase sigma-70 factor (ECF subfamily)